MSTPYTLLLSTADSSAHLGRLDYASLSQQALMEMVIDGITNTEKICRSTDFSKDIADWRGVLMDDDGYVTSILIDQRNLTGSLALEWLPPSIVKVHVSHTNLLGTLMLERLPDGLVYVNINRNDLNGSLCLERLPRALKELNLSSNTFSGSINLTKLPNTMESINLIENTLSGTLDLTQLPDTLTSLGLSHNTFAEWQQKHHSNRSIIVTEEQWQQKHHSHRSNILCTRQPYTPMISPFYQRLTFIRSLQTYHLTKSPIG